MRHKISNELDLLVARAEAETDKARDILSSARIAEDYWREKVAAKLVEFCEHEEKAMRLYVESKLYHPELGDLIEKRWPHFRAARDDAREKLADIQPDHGNY